MQEAGKGSKQRPTDYNKYYSNYDAIFSKKKHDIVVVEDNDLYALFRCSRCSKSETVLVDISAKDLSWYNSYCV